MSKIFFGFLFIISAASTALCQENIRVDAKLEERANFSAPGDSDEVSFTGKFNGKHCQGTVVLDWNTNALTVIRSRIKLSQVMCENGLISNNGYGVGRDGKYGFQLSCNASDRGRCVSASVDRGEPFTLVVRPTITLGDE